MAAFYIEGTGKNRWKHRLYSSEADKFRFKQTPKKQWP